MISNGLTITVVGMAIVFAFLIVLVLMMNLLFALLKRFLPKALEPPDGENKRFASRPSSGPGAATSDLAPIAAIVAAVRAHTPAN